MFDYADKDGDGKLSFGEFLLVINPPKPDKDMEGVVKQVICDNLARDAEEEEEDKEEEGKTVQFDEKNENDDK